MEIAGRTHVGHVRARNEDTIGWDEKLGVAVIADGMGGHPAGDVASRIAVDTCLAVARHETDAGHTWLARGDADATGLVAAADDAIRDHGRRVPETAGLGTTLLIAAIADTRLVIAHVGDSRIYRLRAGHLERLTHDQNEAEYARLQGWLTADQARHSPARHQLLQALGSTRPPVPDVVEGACRPGDLLLMCTDGLTGELSDAEIHALLTERGTADEATADRLVAAALSHGGRDNVSVVLIAP